MILGLKEKLIKILFEKNLVTQVDLDKAIAVQKDKGGSLSDILVDFGYVSRNDLMVVLSQELGIPPINLARYKIDPVVIKLIPKKIAKNYKILPLSKIGDTLMVAMVDPLNIFTIDEITTLTGFKISPVITTEKDIKEAMAQYYDEETHAVIDKIIDDMHGDGDI